LNGVGALIVVLIASAGGTVALAGPTTQPAEPPTFFTLKFTQPSAPDSVEEQLAAARARPAGLLKYGPVSLIDPVWDALDKGMEDVGLEVGLSYTAVYQLATGGPGQRDAAGGDADLFGTWRLLGGKNDPYVGYLSFAFESRHDLGTGIPPRALGGQIGSLWGTTNGFNEEPLCVKELYWKQSFAGDRLIVRIGRLDAENLYDRNYWQSDSKFFLNQAFSAFPVRSLPGSGLGMNLTAKFGQQWYVCAGFQDAQGKTTTIDVDTFFEDFNLFYAVEIGYTPKIPGWGDGTYRLTVWYRDAGETDGKPHDAGFDFSFDQHLGPHVVPFFRFGLGEGNINGIDAMISTGVGWEGKLVTSSDVIGVAGSWGRPSDHDLRDQFAVEAFYRLQVSPDNQLTFGYQVIVNPTFDTSEAVVGVLELRWRIAL
jgi:porin